MTAPIEASEFLTRARRLCHDMNQPLTVLLARSELLLMKVPPGEPYYKNVEQIHDQSEKMGRLVEELRNLIKEFQGDT
jgi:signal transduction histidine kinase